MGGEPGTSADVFTTFPSGPREKENLAAEGPSDLNSMVKQTPQALSTLFRFRSTFTLPPADLK
jgi:hypothetical protein